MKQLNEELQMMLALQDAFVALMTGKNKPIELPNDFTKGVGENEGFFENEKINDAFKVFVHGCALGLNIKKQI